MAAAWVGGRGISRGVVVVVVAAACLAGRSAGAEPPPARSHEQVMGDMGLVRHQGSWRTAQEIELLERDERQAAAVREWRARLEALRRRLEKPAESARAAEEIRGISEPAATAALVAGVAREESARVRGLYVEALSRIRSFEAFGALVALALDHRDPETRLVAAERLAKIGPEEAVPPLVAALGDPDNQRVNRAAEVLGRLGVAAAVPALIDALETPHLSLQGDGPPEGSTTATFTPDGGGGFSTGGGAKRVRVRVRNEQVYAALVALTGVNLGFDPAAWKEWLAARQAPPPGFDLRRG